MIFKLYFSPLDAVTLPIAHHHIIQGLIYNILSYNERYSSFLHNQGRQYHESTYKLFTFGPLTGHYVINKNHTITFDQSLSLEIRSPDPYFCETMNDVLSQQNEYTLGQNIVFLDRYDLIECQHLPTSITIQMISPIVIYHTYENKTIYHNPLDQNYNQYINDNFQKKYLAAYQELPDPIELSALSVGLKDKYVTLFKKRTYITGWKGIYLLKGESSSLSFLYEVGLGAKNSQGFGMFKIK